MTRFERLASGLTGICYGFVALYFAATGGGPQDLYRTVLAFGAAFGIAVISPLTAVVESNVRGFIAWARALGHISLALTLVEGLAGPQLASFRPRTVSTPFTLDPYTWMIVGGLSLWLLAVNVRALQRRAWSRRLAYAGCTAGVLGMAFPIAVFFAIQRLAPYEIELPLATGIGILFPVWFVWVAIAAPRA